jgi:hypothetical protein
MKKVLVFCLILFMFLTGCGRISNKDISEPVQPPASPSVFASQIFNYGQLHDEIGASVRLSWSVENTSIAGVVIKRSTENYPQDISEGEMVSQIDRSTNNYTDKNLSMDVTYYYSLWTYNSNNDHSETFITSSIHTYEPEEGAVFAISQTHVPGILSVENIIEVSWYAYSLSGIAGYSILWSQNANDNPSQQINTTANSTTSPALADGVWYFHVKAKNNAGVWGETLHYGPFYINSGTIPLPEITITTSNPRVSLSETDWSAKNTISITWSATNIDDSDVGGYSYVFSSQASTEPDETSEGTNKSATSQELSNGVWYFHIKGKNNLGLWGSTSHYGPFRLDSSPPTTPGVMENIVFTNMNPPTEEWSDDNTVFLQWQYVGTGIVEGYSYVWDKQEFTMPNTTSEGLGTETTSPPLADGEWYFHIRAKNAQGWSQAIHCGPFYIDTMSPQQVSDITVLPSDGKITFRWERPEDPTFAGTIVVRKNNGYPTSIDDGLIIHNEWSRNLEDTGLVNDTNYYYSFWSVDYAGNMSSPANIVAQAYNNYSNVDDMVSSVTEGDQRNSKMAKFSNNSFVVLYMHKVEDGGFEYDEIYAEIYDQNAYKTIEGIKLPIPADKPVASDYSVTTLTNGNFVVAWSVNKRDIYAQIFNTSGGSLGNPFRISAVAAYEQRRPAIEGLSNGDFVVVWQAGEKDINGPDGSRRSVQARIYSSNGQARTNEFTVNQWTYKHQQRPSVAKYSGGFVVAWQSRFKDGVDEDWAGDAIAARRFSNNGSALSDEVLVNDIMRYKDQKQVKVASLSNGGYAIAWHSGDSSSPPAFYHGIYARVYNSSGSPIGSDFLVRNALSDPIKPIDEDFELDPNDLGIAGLSDGSFVIVYDNINGLDKDASNRGDSYGVFAKKFSSTGSQIGSEVQVNRFCIGDQKEPQIISLKSGQMFITWESKGQNEGVNDSGVFGRKL